MYIALLFLLLFISNKTYANDIGDILRNLESPDVDYHIDNNIKIIKDTNLKTPNDYVLINNSCFITNNDTRVLEKNFEKKIFVKENDVKINKNDVEKVAIIDLNTTAEKDSKNIKIEKNNETVPKKDLKTTIQEKKQDNNIIKSSNEDKKSNIIKENKTIKNVKKELKIVETNYVVNQQKNNINDYKKSEPIKIYKLFLFFYNMPFVGYWRDGINENISFLSNISLTILDFWKKESDKKETNEVENESEELENEVDEIDKEESQDYSSFDPLLEKAEEYYRANKWGDLQKIIDENDDFSAILPAQRYRLMLELNKENPNVNVVKNISNSILKDNPNSIEANYGMAYYYFYNKKKTNLNLANTHIMKAIKGKKPLKPALKLSKIIALARYKIPIIIGILFVIINVIIAISLIKKKIKNIRNSNIQEEIVQSNEIQENANIIDSKDNLINNQVIEGNTKEENADSLKIENNSNCSKIENSIIEESLKEDNHVDSLIIENKPISEGKDVFVDKDLSSLYQIKTNEESNNDSDINSTNYFNDSLNNVVEEDDKISNDDNSTFIDEKISNFDKVLDNNEDKKTNYINNIESLNTNVSSLKREDDPKSNIKNISTINLNKLDENQFHKQLVEEFVEEVVEEIIEEVYEDEEYFEEEIIEEIVEEYA